MSERVLQRFLGLRPGVDDRTLLGMPAAPSPLTAEAIHAALAIRLLRVDRHPDRDGSDASIARGLLRDAASRLRAGTLPPSAGASAPRATPGAAGISAAAGSSGATGVGAASPPSAPPRPPAGHPAARHAHADSTAAAPRRPDIGARPPAAPTPLVSVGRPSPPRALTPFDRMVLATLVSGGGWNAVSRQRLVALAASRGVGVDGLVKVVSGLAHHVRRGGVRPGMGDMAEGATLLLADRKHAPPSRFEAIVDHVAQTVGDELRSERLAPRIRVTVAFAFVTLAMLATLVKVMLSDGTTAVRETVPESPGSATRADSEDAGAAPSPGFGAAMEPQPGHGADGLAIGSVQPAKFPRPPSFTGTARPAASLELLERAAGLPALVETLGRRIAVGDVRTSAAVDREWSLAIDEAGGCWPLMDRGARQRTIAAFIEALRAADVPALAERFVGALQRGPTVPAGPARGGADGVPALWEGAFRAGLLGEILARGAVLPPAVIEHAGAALRHAMVEPIAGGFAGFDDAAGRWLDLQVEPMVARLPSTANFADEWEHWIVAQRAVRNGEPLQQAYADVAGALLRSGSDLGSPGAPSDVLGRFVQLLEFNDTPAVRSAMLRWLDDPRIQSDALWVLTSLMQRKGDIRWFRGELMVDWNAAPEHRAVIAKAIESHWPAPSAPMAALRPMTAIANDALERWVAALRLLEAKAAASRDPTASVRTVLLTAMVNEAAAAFEVGQDDRARELVAGVHAALAPDGAEWPRRGALVRPARGVAGGADGEFADAYEQAERNTEQRLALLRQLRLRGEGDLGPRDAEALVRTVTRGTPPEARSVARGVLVEAFPHGPNVTLELLDQLPEVGPSEELGQVISQIADATLPPARSAEWTRSARLALIRHVLLLRDDVAIDADAELLSDTLRGRLQLATAGPAPAVPSGPLGMAPQQVLARVVDAWRRRAGAMIATRPVPAELAELDRRRALRDRLARGAIASLVAEQIAQVELAAYVIAATAPWLETACRDLIDAAAADRASADTATAQSVATELALAHLWELALVGDPTLGLASRLGALPRDRAAEGATDVGVRAGDEHGAAPPSGAPPKGGAPTDGERRRPARPTVAPPGVEQPIGIKPPPRGGGGGKP